MKIVKIKHRLILREPGKEDKTLFTGTKKACEEKRIDFSFVYNSEWLVIEEKLSDHKEAKLTLSGFLGFMLMAGLVYISWIKGGDEEVCVTD